jgi:peptidoglycan/LPS O-acetylase OafA/YrhL
LRNRWLVYAAVGTVLYGLRIPYLLDFLLGMGVCDLYVAFWVGRRRGGLIPGVASVLAVVAGLTMAGIRPEWVTAAQPGWAGKALIVWRLVAPALVIAGVVMSPVLQRVLSVRPFVWLGWASFSLYLVHVPVECSLSCWLYLSGLREGLDHATSALLASAASVAVSLLLAWVGARTVEPFSIWFGKQLEARVFRKPRVVTAPPP